MINKIIKKALAPIVRELVQEEQTNYVKIAADCVLKDLNKAMAEAVVQSHPVLSGKTAPDSSK